MVYRGMDRTYADYTFYVEPIGNNLPETIAMWKAHWGEQKEEELRGQTFCPAIDLFFYTESRGDFSYITVRKGDELVGHFGLGFGINRQTSLRVAGDEFFYLKPEHRRGLLAVKLIKFAKAYAFRTGAHEFSLSYRVTVDDLDPVMRRCGLHKIANVYTARR